MAIDFVTEEALLDAEEALRQAIDKCEALERLCDEQDLGENGAANLRMNRYLLPHLATWLYDEDQMGSLASIRHELAHTE